MSDSARLKRLVHCGIEAWDCSCHFSFARRASQEITLIAFGLVRPATEHCGENFPHNAAWTDDTRPAQARRGETAAPIKVFHDHSRLGDKNYFEPECDTLLVVEGGNLTVTPSGGETAMVIPAAEILEIRMNIAVAKESGAFHIVTKQGLYLHFAPEGATSDEGRADVDSLRSRLGLDQ